MPKERSVFNNDLHKSTLEQHVPTFFFDLQRRCFLKKLCLKYFANFTVKHLRWNLFLFKLQALQALQLYLKKSPAQVFSWGIRETFKSIYFVEHLHVEHLQTSTSGSCKYSIWTCFEIKDVDSSEFFRKMKLPFPHFKKMAC